MGRTFEKGEVRERILLVAMEMIATHGLDGVSIRGINAAAGFSPAAFHYHFGTLENVVLAILESEMKPLMEQRIAMIKAAKKNRTPLTIRTLLEIQILPPAWNIIETEERGARYSRFFARLYNDNNPLISTFRERHYEQASESLNVLYREVLAHLPQEIIDFRTISAASTWINTLANLKRTPRPLYDEQKIENKNELWKRVISLIDFLVAGMEAPISEESPALFLKGWESCFR